MLSALFIGMAVAEHDHPEHAGAEEDDIDEVSRTFLFNFFVNFFNTHYYGNSL